MIVYPGGGVINYSENRPRKQWSKEPPQTLMDMLSNADVSLAFKTYTIYTPGKSPFSGQTFLQTGLLIKAFSSFFSYIAPLYTDHTPEFISQQARFWGFLSLPNETWTLKSQVWNS